MPPSEPSAAHVLLFVARARCGARSWPPTHCSIDERRMEVAEASASMMRLPVGTVIESLLKDGVVHIATRRPDRAEDWPTFTLFLSALVPALDALDADSPVLLRGTPGELSVTGADARAGLTRVMFGQDLSLGVLDRMQGDVVITVTARE
jgi:hypothetical protein